MSRPPVHPSFRPGVTIILQLCVRLFVRHRQLGTAVHTKGCGGGRTPVPPLFQRDLCGARLLSDIGQATRRRGMRALYQVGSTVWLSCTLRL